MPMFTEGCVFNSEVFHSSVYYRTCRNRLRVSLYVFMKRQGSGGGAPVVTPIGSRDVYVVFSHIKQSSSYRSRCAQRIAQNLSSLGVPEDKQPSVLEKIFEVVDVSVSPDQAILVSMWFYNPVPVNVQLSPPIARFVPATRSSIVGLLQVRVDSGLIIQTPSCVICDEDFADQLMITRMPCAHHYHTHCIVRWLEINHMCPLCRFPMPTVEAAEPSNP
ncbi:hypothetical protein ABKV19_010821 [Rosa sericea]